MYTTSNGKYYRYDDHELFIKNELMFRDRMIELFGDIFDESIIGLICDKIIENKINNVNTYFGKALILASMNDDIKKAKGTIRLRIVKFYLRKKYPKLVRRA